MGVTRGDLPGIEVFGRPFKPVARGFTFTMLIIAQSNFRGDDRGTHYPLTSILGTIAIISVTSLILGWVLKVQRLAEIGLLCVIFTYMTRAMFIQFTNAWDQAVFFSLASVVIAGGSYYLEAADRQRSCLPAQKGDK